MSELAKITKNLGGLISKNSPHILTGLGCAGVLSTAVLAVRGTPKAMEILEVEAAYRERKRIQAMTKLDKVKLTWKCYIPAGVVGATTIGCIIGANTVHTRRNAALASLYALSESAFREYKTKVVQEIGKAKETKVRDEIAKDHITNNPPQANSVIITGTGDVLCCDKLGERYFYSSYETIRQKINNLNYRLRHEMNLSLNEFYYEMNLSPTKLGEMMEFNIDKGEIEPHYSTQLTEDGKPCLVIDMEVYPINLY
ncbi:MAG: DUF6353 family protein [Gudongella sp.]|jgi:hypothetical protein|nr:DUF6353 family protein [Gudongella sp.]